MRRRHRHTKTDIVVTVIGFVVVAVGTASVPVIIVERAAAKNAGTFRPALPPFLAAGILYSRLFAPAAQNSAYLNRHAADMLILPDGDEFQIMAQADIYLQAPQGNIGFLQMARLIVPQPGRQQRILQFKGAFLYLFGQHKTMLLGKFLRGWQQPFQQIIRFGKDG